MPLVNDHANRRGRRTFSKAFALAGARIGYVLASPPSWRISPSRSGARTT